MAHDVFISHSTEDKPAADAVCAILEKNGVRCWIAPRDITPGADWGESIVDAIRTSRVLLLLFSTNANKSRQIKREVEVAADGNVTIVPLRIENILPTESFKYFLGNIHWLDALTPPLEKHLEEVAAKVKGILSTESVTPSEVPHPPLPPKPLVVQRSVHRNVLPVISGILGVMIVASAILFVWQSRRPALIPSNDKAASPSLSPVRVVSTPPPVAPPSPVPSPVINQAVASSSPPVAPPSPVPSPVINQTVASSSPPVELATTQEAVPKTAKSPQPQQQRSEAQSQSPAAASVWLFPDSNSRLLSDGDLAGLDCMKLWIARNEIYARNGYIFSTQKGKSYAATLGKAYQGTDANQDRVRSQMNSVERQNIERIKYFERLRSCP